MTTPRTKNPADIGGEEAGPIDTVDHGLKFWEKQANALRNTLSSRRIVRLDELRRAAEDLGERYYQLSYFQRTTEAMRNLLVEKNYFSGAELERKMAEVRKRHAP
jgi:Nitrile hydratase beta subunit